MDVVGCELLDADLFCGILVELEVYKLQGKWKKSEKKLQWFKRGDESYFITNGQR